MRHFLTLMNCMLTFACGFCLSMAYLCYEHTRENLIEMRSVENRVDHLCNENMISNRKVMGALGFKVEELPKKTAPASPGGRGVASKGVPNK